MMSSLSMPPAPSQPIAEQPSVAEVEVSPPVTADVEERLRELPLDLVHPNPDQPRRRYEQGALERLAESIRLNGVLQPIVVREVDGRFEIVAGERRWRASRLAGLGTIPALVRVADDLRSAEWAMIENLQREDLNPMERAEGLRRLVVDFSMTHQVAAERVGLDRATVSNLLRLLELDASTAALVASGALSQGHAKVLLSVPSGAARESLAKEAIRRAWSVRRLEAEVRRSVAPPAVDLTPPPAATGPVSASLAAVRDLERRISEALGSAVRVQLGRRKGQGRIVVDFHSLEQLDGLLERFGVADQ